ncbi:hypothetical protein ACIQB5_49040 [Streptomyces sp. NPDC088560]|uniref:hypothetical protein n=1 Tax=Streptomyces sp. NPDC088560 TaxID=3365868 RepID=UPI00382B5E7F
MIVTGFHASRTHKLTPGEKTASRMVAYARARGIAVEVVWPAGAARDPAGCTAAPRVPERRR